MFILFKKNIKQIKTISWSIFSISFLFLSFYLFFKYLQNLDLQNIFSGLVAPLIIFELGMMGLVAVEENNNLPFRYIIHMLNTTIALEIMLNKSNLSAEKLITYTCIIIVLAFLYIYIYKNKER